MVDFQSIVKAVTETAAEVLETSGIRQVYEEGFERAKGYAEMAKLSIEANRDSEELNRVFAEIGRLYYDQVEGKGEGIYEPLFAQVVTISDSIQTSQENLEAARARLLAKVEESKAEASEAEEPVMEAQTEEPAVEVLTEEPEENAVQSSEPEAVAGASEASEQ